MMKRGVVVLIISLFLLCSAMAYAQTVTPTRFFVNMEYESDNIVDPSTDYADIYVVVENKGLEADTFKIRYLEDTAWSYQILDPLTRQLTLEPGEKGKFHILVRTTKTQEGLYNVRVPIDAETSGTRIAGTMRIRVGKTVPDTPPVANFDVDVSVPAQMDPRGTYNVVVNIKNNNARLLEDVEVKLASNILNEVTKVAVNPNESKGISFAVILMDNIKPQKDQLHVTVNYEGDEFHSSDHNFEVVEYLPAFRTEVDLTKKFLRQERTIKIFNDGNAPKSDVVRLETSLKERFFSKSVPKFSVMTEGGRRYFAWDISLGPEESAEIELRTSYRLLLLLAMIIIVLLAYKVATSNPLIVKKKTVAMKKHGGAITELAVVIYLKNRSKESITNLRVVERVSRMVHLKNDSFTGSMHPVKMHTNGNDGTLLEYRFGELGAGDERIIKYKVHSKLPIFGTLTIKPTTVEFVKKNGAKKKSWSRPLSIMTDEVSKAPEAPKKKHEHKAHEHHRHK